MNDFRLLRAGTVALAGLSLAACGNAPGREVSAASIARGVVSAVIGQDDAQSPDPDRVAQQAAAALANSDGEVIVVAIPNRDALAVMQEIERNGPYVTFGTADRRSVTLKNGILTGTRGLGYDLMSAEVAETGTLIRTQGEGAGRRVNRYLDGENLTVAISPWCQVKLGGTGRVNLGEVNAATRQVAESCVGERLAYPGGTAERAAFQNSYQVTASGRVVQSRQWISPLNGYITIQSLR